MKTTINEGSTCYLNLKFYDDVGEPMTPSKVTYQVHNKADDAEVVPPLEVAPAAEVKIRIAPDDNQMLDETLETETRQVTIVAEYAAGSDAVTDVIDYDIQNLKQL